MRLHRRDAPVFLFVTAAAVVYALWALGAAMTDVSTRVVAAVVLGLGWAGCTSNQAQLAEVYGAGSRRRAHMAYIVVASLLGALALGAGIIAIVTSSEAMLATLVAAMVALWAMSTLRHAIRARRPVELQAAGERLGKAA